jgi:hypothetical protein
MPQLTIQAGDGKRWTAHEHSKPYRTNGPKNREPSRKRKVTHKGETTECFLGNPAQRLKNGRFRGGTRVNIRLGNSWWHITESDQAGASGEKSNLYKLMLDADLSYSFD